ncbi:hypothetical protein KAU55_01395 [Candidatus Bathyarchaeota archaeon]|nr:hypothetical protein [Candidatus Bathyarchaeota archaeon]
MLRKTISGVIGVLLMLSVLTTSSNMRFAIGGSTENNCDFFGVGEPLMSRSAWGDENLNLSKAFEIMENLSVCRLREWVWRRLVFNESGTGLNQNIVEALSNVLEEAHSRNISVMGMVQDFPSWMTKIESGEFFQQIVPSRDLTEGSPYKKFLDCYEKSWETLARTFPDITMWEIGNEYNLDDFLHPEGYNQSDPSSPRFSFAMKVNIVTDVLYYGSRGIHAGNPEAITVMCGLARGGNGIYDIRDFLESIYENIESDEWPSANTSDFFQVACWHPYLLAEEPTPSGWVEPNIAVRNVMINHKDSSKLVVFSEFGYSDHCTGLNGTQIADYLTRVFTLANESFRPWLQTLYWFRLIDPDPNFDKLPCYEYGFGLTKSPAENYTLKLVADAYTEIVPEFPSAIILLSAMVFIALVVIVMKKKFSKM